MAIRCRLFGHRWIARHESTGKLHTGLIPMPFGFEWRLWPMLIPEKGAYLGLFCERCGVQHECKS